MCGIQVVTFRVGKEKSGGRVVIQNREQVGKGEYGKEERGRKTEVRGIRRHTLSSGDGKRGKETNKREKN